MRKQNNKEIIERVRPTEVRAAEGDEKIVEGRAVVFGEPTDICGWFQETIAPGALDETDLSDVRFCKNHDTTNVFARSKKGKGTLQLNKGDEGLDVAASLDTEGNPLAATLYSEISRGDIDGMSFMFTVEAEEWEDLETDYPKRTITKIGTILEVSAVTFPAYPQTSIGARAKDALENARSAAEAARALKEAAADKLQLEKEKIKLITI